VLYCCGYFVVIACYLLTIQSQAVVHPLMKFLAVYVTEGVISRPLYLSWSRRIHSTLPHPVIWGSLWKYPMCAWAPLVDSLLQIFVWKLYIDFHVSQKTIKLMSRLAFEERLMSTKSATFLMRRFNTPTWIRAKFCTNFCFVFPIYIDTSVTNTLVERIQFCATVYSA
jgi:hypothetical protein